MEKDYTKLGGSLLFFMFLSVLIFESMSAVDVCWAYKEFYESIPFHIMNTAGGTILNIQLVVNIYSIVGVLYVGSYFATIGASIKILLIILRKSHNGHITITRLLIEWFIIVRAIVSFLGYVIARVELREYFLSERIETISSMIFSDIKDSIIYIVVFMIYLNISKGVRYYFNTNASLEGESKRIII